MEPFTGNLCSPAVVKELLHKYGLAPQKAFGQNFLINGSIPAQIAQASVPPAAWQPGFDRELCALEIGPGLGAMTRELSRLYDRVAAVEIDRGLIPLLRETLAGCDNVTVVNADFMKLSVPEFLKEQFGEREVHVCANLPYYITTPILMRLLEAVRPSQPPQIRSVTVLVQAEVADRLCADAGAENYGSITASLNLVGTAEKILQVSAGNFLPQPKVTSTVVQVRLYPGGVRDAFPNLPEDDGALDALIARAKLLIGMAFEKRRKTLTNALSGVASKEAVANALSELGLRADIRGERLSAAEFVALAQKGV